jgi:hypothetical protein
MIEPRTYWTLYWQPFSLGITVLPGTAALGLGLFLLRFYWDRQLFVAWDANHHHKWQWFWPPQEVPDD